MMPLRAVNSSHFFANSYQELSNLESDPQLQPNSEFLLVPKILETIQLIKDEIPKKRDLGGLKEIYLSNRFQKILLHQMMKTIREIKNLFELFRIAVKTCSLKMIRNASAHFMERVRSEVVDLEGHDNKSENDMFR